MKLKVMTFNIQHGRNHNLPGDVIDLPLMLETVRSCDPDILSLNEVRKGHEDNCYPDEPKFFEKSLGCYCYFGDALQFRAGRLYGNAVCSKYPFVKAQKYMIPDVPKEERKGFYYETRCIIRSDYVIDEKQLTVLSSHFGLVPEEQDNAVDLVLKIAETINNPIILMGDFNMTPDNHNISRLASVFTDVHGYLGKSDYTFTSDKPKEKIDYIFSKGLKIVNADTVKVIASDHFPITAEFEF